MATDHLQPHEREFLARAAVYLENPSFLMRVADKVGKPLEFFARAVPRPVHKLVEKALTRTLDWSLRTFPVRGTRPSDLKGAEQAGLFRGRMHQLASGVSGFAGGFFGLPGLAVELPVSTGIMYRSIASIAEEFGEDISDPKTKLECLTVFSYGGAAPDQPQEAMESTYLTTRLGLSVLISQAAQVLARGSADELAAMLARGVAPVLARLIARLAGRYQTAVAEKFLVQSVPVIGAAGGAFVNVAFTQHFNTVARYHFGIRRLERQYGKDVVQNTYLGYVRQAKARGVSLFTEDGPPRLTDQGAAAPSR